MNTTMQRAAQLLVLAAALTLPTMASAQSPGSDLLQQRSPEERDRIAAARGSTGRREAILLAEREASLAAGRAARARALAARRVAHATAMAARYATRRAAAELAQRRAAEARRHVAAAREAAEADHAHD